MQTRIQRFILVLVVTLGLITQVAQAQIQIDSILVTNTSCGLDNGAIEVIVSGGQAPYMYSLDGGAMQIDSLFEDQTAGTFEVRVTDDLGETVLGEAIIASSTPIEVTIEVENDTICTKDSNFRPTINLNVPLTGEFSWAPTMETVNPLPVTMEGEYSVSVTNINGIEGCEGTAVREVFRCPDFKIPNAFTPNGDNLNDTFGPVIVGAIVEIKEFQIFNRWGEVVHDLTTPWDGQVDGNPAPSGVYIYRMVLEINDNGITRTDTPAGDVTLLR